uniref:SFRICE_018503 n=1 Tax=Spodoptera frugiperda TaxID=7108 RepID=A0A2H1VAI6_SPOFR
MCFAALSPPGSPLRFIEMVVISFQRLDGTNRQTDRKIEDRKTERRVKLSYSYVAVDAFGFEQSYSLVHIALHWWKRTRLNYVFYKKRFLTIIIYIAYSSYTSSSQQLYSLVLVETVVMNFHVEVMQMRTRLPRWSSGRKCDCRTLGLGFDSRVGQSITGLFSDFRKFLGSSTESGVVSRKWSGCNVNMKLLHGWGGGWANGYRATCSGFDSCTEQHFELYKNRTKCCSVIHKLLFRVWVSCVCDEEEKILVG